MKKRILRVVYLSLALILILSVVSACKSKKSTQSESGSSTSSKVSGTAAKGSATSARVSGSAARASGSALSGETDVGQQTGPVATDEQGNVIQPTPDPNTGYTPREWNVNLGGQSVRLESRRIVNDLQKYTEEEYNYTPEEAKAKFTTISSMSSYIYMRNLKEAAQKYNYVNDWNYNSARGTNDMRMALINNVAAGVWWADVIELHSMSAIPDIALLGYILPIDDYVDFNDPLLASPWIQTAANWKGKNYAVSRPVNVNSGITYNLNLFNQFNLPDLNALVQDNNWTWDTFLQVAKSGTIDLNGDGVIDIWGFEGGNTYFVAKSNGAEYLLMDPVTYRYSIGLHSPAGIRALQFLSQIANIDKVMDMSPETSSQGIPSTYAKFWNGEICMFFSNTNIQSNTSPGEKPPMGFVPGPRGPDSTRPYMQAVRTDTSYWVFPINTRYKELIPIISWAEVRWDSNLPLYVPLESITGGGRSQLARPIDSEMWDRMSRETSLDFGPGMIGGTIDQYFGTPVLNNILTPQAALTGNMAVVQAALDLRTGQQ